MVFTDLGNGKIETLVGKDESRYVLKEVWFDAENGRLVATNGHALAITHVKPEKGDTSGPIPPAALTFWRAQDKIRAARKFGVVTFKANEKFVIIEDQAEGLTKKFPRAAKTTTFANYEAVLPQVEGPPTVCLSIDLLRKVVEAIGRPEVSGSASTSEMVAFWVDAPGRALLVKTSESGALGIIMPMRSNEDKWLTTLEAIEGKAGKKAQVVAITEEEKTAEVESEAPSEGVPDETPRKEVYTGNVENVASIDERTSEAA